MRHFNLNVWFALLPVAFWAGAFFGAVQFEKEVCPLPKPAESKVA